MNEKEVAELRRQLKPDRHSISHIYGCYVSENKEIIATVDQSMGLVSQEEGEAYLNLLKKSLSGGIGRNLIDINFTTQQVVDSEEHKLLMTLRETKLSDEETRHQFFQKIVQSLNFPDNYLILLAHNAYDVPFRGKDGGNFSEASDEVFSYLLCSICPVKKSRPGLGYDYTQKDFRTFAGDWLVGTPQLGFLFPAFDDRSTNLYGALYYTRNLEESHQELVDTIFHTDIPKPAEEQKRSFEAILSTALEDECSLKVVQTVRTSCRI
jgi:hypothetical protein